MHCMHEQNTKCEPGCAQNSWKKHLAGVPSSDALAATESELQQVVISPTEFNMVVNLFAGAIGGHVLKFFGK